VGLVVGLAAGGTFAWAAIPNSTSGNITACYPTSGTSKGALRVIDYESGARCAAGEALVSWGSTRCNGFPRPGVDWHGCDFQYANVNYQNFIGANLSGITLSGSQSNGVRFNSANLSGANLSTAVVARSYFNGANLRTANLSGVGMAGSDFAGANVTGANFTNASIAGQGPLNSSSPSTWTTTKLRNVVGLTSAQLKTVRASTTIYNSPPCPSPGTGNGRSLSYIQFPLILSGWDLSLSRLLGNVFDGTNLSGANLSRSEVSGSSFKNANLTNANLSCAYINGSDLTGANLSGANLTNTSWRYTICPNGENSTHYEPERCFP
jgi:uncharacterized protein YjbI with pentapeptide repeats